MIEKIKAFIKKKQYFKKALDRFDEASTRLGQDSSNAAEYISTPNPTISMWKAYVYAIRRDCEEYRDALDAICEIDQIRFENKNGAIKQEYLEIVEKIEATLQQF